MGVKAKRHKRNWRKNKALVCCILENLYAQTFKGAKWEWRYKRGGPKRQHNHFEVYGVIRQASVPKLVGGVLCFSGSVPNSFLRNPGILHRAPGVSLRRYSVACLSSSQQTSVIVFPTLQIPRHEGVRETENIAPSINDLGTRQRWVFTSYPGRFTPGKETACHLDRRFGGSQRPPRYSVKIKIFWPVGNERSVVIWNVSNSSSTLKILFCANVDLLVLKLLVFMYV